ncbi:MAG TPA: queuosine precursor transporter [Bacteroidales bacterium]|nr:queuosine precursor transporter [Bacteroidales bacterium]
MNTQQTPVLNPKLRSQAEMLYLILGALFITALVTSNLIFQKFFYWNPLGLFRFELSVGIIAYPVTFLVTDIVSEVYGKRRANFLVIAGIFASAFALLIVIVSTYAPATDWSPLSDVEFKKAFGFTFLAVAASLAAYLAAQFIDVQVFHFWKGITKGKHLWLRNNLSTFTSQFIDTFTVLFLLCSFGVIEWALFSKLLGNGFLFKVIIALLDTPFAYLGVYGLRRFFGISGHGAELNLDE